MFIYLADASQERGQKTILAQEFFINTLCSYAYRSSGIFGANVKYWEELLRIHLASTTQKLQGDVNIHTVIPLEQKAEYLASYAYKKDEPIWKDTWEESIKIHLAGIPSRSNDIQSQIFPEIECHLGSFAHKSEIEFREKYGK